MESMNYEEKVTAEYQKALPLMRQLSDELPLTGKEGKFRICERVKSGKAGYMQDGPINILILGDSVSHGCVGGTVTHDYHTVYHNRLRLMIQHTFPTVPINVINNALSGTMASFAAAIVCDRLKQYKPDLVIVCFGLNDVNDTEEAYERSLRTIFEACRDTATDCIFMTPNMLNTYVSEYTVIAPDYAPKTAAMQIQGKMDRFMDSARKISAEYNIAVCDTYRVWRSLYDRGIDTTLLLANLINHPIRPMHRLFAELLYRTIFGILPDGEDASASGDDGMFRI